MNKVLFVLYYVPPMGGSGVQRPLKFMKYLRDYGWEPLVLCPQAGTYPYIDESLNSEFKDLDIEVFRVEAETPFHTMPGIAERFSQLPDMLARPVRKINRLLMYPDNKKAWIQPAVEKGVGICKEHKIDLIFSSAPPFSNHVIAHDLNELTDIPYVLDYRDLWVESHFHRDEFGWQKKKRIELEREWLENAAGVVMLDEYASDMLRGSLDDEQSSKIIPHGYDPEDLTSDDGATLLNSDNRVDLLYSGLFYEDNQPDILLQAVSELLAEDPMFPVHLHFQGKLENRHRALIDELNVSNYVTDHGYLNHSKAASNLLRADVLWVMDGFNAELRQVKSGKLFEYFGTGKPILGINHHGAMEELLLKYGASYIARPDSVSSVKERLTEIAENWRQDSFPEANRTFTDKFDRKLLAGELAHFLTECTESKAT